MSNSRALNQGVVECHNNTPLGKAPRVLQIMAATKKRQWQRYVDESLLKTNQVTNVAIHGLDGTEWASSKNFHVSSKLFVDVLLWLPY